jgi:extradiol dioxygenase family protein
MLIMAADANLRAVKSTNEMQCQRLGCAQGHSVDDRIDVDYRE